MYLNCFITSVNQIKQCKDLGFGLTPLFKLDRGAQLIIVALTGTLASGKEREEQRAFFLLSFFFYSSQLPRTFQVSIHMD